jgi:hypothetical protein
MNESNHRERLFVARCSLVLFIGGLLVPFIIAVMVFAVSGRHLSEDAKNIAGVLAVGFGSIAEILALICGIIGRRHLSGKIGMIGAIVVLVIAPALAIVLALYEVLRDVPAAPVEHSLF